MLPHDFPPHATVYFYFRKWHRKGIWQQMQDQLRDTLRQSMGRTIDSSVAIADSQSVKTAEKRGASAVLTMAKRLRGVSATSL